MNRKTGIIIALILAVVCTLLIVTSANRKYAAATRAVKVMKAAEFIPAGELIGPGMVEAVNVPEQMAQGLATGDVEGRSVKVPVLKGQYLLNDAVDTVGRRPGYAEIYVPVDVPGSACAMSGDYVDIYQKGDNNSPSVLLLKRAWVLHTVDSGAKQTEPGKSSGPAAMGGGTAVAIGIEVPDDQVLKIVGPASDKKIYLVRSAE